MQYAQVLGHEIRRWKHATSEANRDNATKQASHVASKGLEELCCAVMNCLTSKFDHVEES